MYLVSNMTIWVICYAYSLKLWVGIDLYALKFKFDSNILLYSWFLYQCLIYSSKVIYPREHFYFKAFCVLSSISVGTFSCMLPTIFDEIVYGIILIPTYVVFSLSNYSTSNLICSLSFLKKNTYFFGLLEIRIYRSKMVFFLFNLYDLCY